MANIKITAEELVELIQEEFFAYLAEANPCHDPETGFFSDCEKGKVYSLSKRAVRDLNIDPAYAKRGTVVSKKRREPGKIKAKFGLNTSKKKSGGRQTQDGDPISPKRYVSRYPEKYPQNELSSRSRYDKNWKSSRDRRQDDSIGKPDRKKGSWYHGKSTLDDLAKMKFLYEESSEEKLFSYSDLVAIVEDAFAVDESVRQVEESPQADACRKLGFVTMPQAQKRILRSLNHFALASDGKLFPEKEKD